MSELTDEQRRRIEENRQKALKRLQEKQQTTSPVKQPQKTSVAVTNGPLPQPSLPQRPVPANFTQKSNPTVPASSFYSNNRPPVAQNPQKPQNSPNTQARKIITGSITLLSSSRFEVDVGYHQEIIDIMKQMPSKSYDTVTKKWNFDLSDYSSFLQKIRPVSGVQLTPLPSYVTGLMAKRNGASIPDSEEIDLSILGDQLINSLMPFQREGILFGIRHNGRALIADDMGLGKTIQAIALAAYYSSEWPLIVMVPSSVKFVWREQLCRWLPGLASLNSIQVVETAKDFLDPNSRVYICSYEMVIKRKDELTNKRFKVAILDESHLIKAAKAARTIAALQVLKHAKRVLLLSGTPALSRPSELFTQLQAVRPDLFSVFKPFGDRYCDPKVRNGPNGPFTIYTGASNMRELQIVMEHVAMIRRIKKDVLDQLPAKMRQVVVLDPTSIKSSKDFINAAKICDEAKDDKNAFRAALMHFFHETAKIKMQAVRCYISDLLQDESKKFVVFAHHKEMLDALEHLCNEENVGFIRIDGNVSSEERLNCIHRFARNDDCRVSLLSITAANSGIDMSVASLVIFAELFWNPGILVQAEDRCHRIGQRNCVCVQYLIAKNTSDDVVWKMVQNKLTTLSKAGLTKETFSDTTVGEFAAKNQGLITDYIHPTDREEEIPLEILEELANTQELNDSISTVKEEANEDSLGFFEEDEDFVPQAPKTRRKV